MTLFDPSRRIVPGPRRATPKRRIVISWVTTAVLIAVSAISWLTDIPSWIPIVIIAGILVWVTLLSRRWVRQDAAARDNEH